MPLLGMFGIMFCAGFGMYFLGLFLSWSMLKRYGGNLRSKILDVVFSDDSPMKRPENKRDRVIFRVGVFLMAMGVMTVFGGLSVGEDRERRVCVDICRMKGMSGGHFAPSGVQKDDRGEPLRACWCVSPTGSATELVQRPLSEVPRLAGPSGVPARPAGLHYAPDRA